MVDLQEAQWKAASGLYDLNRWVAINSSVSLSLESWFEMPTSVRDALVNEVNELVRQRDKANRDARAQLEANMKGAASGGKLTFPVQPKSFTDNLFR